MTTDLLVRLPDYFSSLIDAMQDGFVLRAPTGAILEVNSAFCDLIDYPREEIIGSSPPHPWWPDSEQAVYDVIVRKYMQGARTEDDLVFQRRDGTRLPVLVTSSPLRDRDGRLLGFIGTMKDMRERQRNADQIRLQAQLIDQAQTAIIATDLQGVVTIWNQGAEQLFGWSRAEALGVNVRELTMNADDRQAEYILERLTRGESWTGEFLARRKDQTTIAVHVTDSPIHDNHGELIGIVGVSSDITERKTVEERLAAQYELSRVLAEQTELRPAAAEILRVLGDGFHWDVGLAWIVDGDEHGAELRLLSSWNAPAHSSQAVIGRRATSRLARGESLPGHVWDARAPVWVSDIGADARMFGRHEAVASGLRSALCFPILGAGGVIGVIEFYSAAARTPDPALDTILGAIGGKSASSCSACRRSRLFAKAKAASGRWRTARRCCCGWLT